MKLQTQWKYLPASLLVFGLLGFAGMSFFSGQTTLFSDNPILKALQKKTAEAQNRAAVEKIYVHTDKTFVVPGEELWMALYLRDAKDLLPAGSEIAYLQLLDPKGSVVLSQTVLAQDGQAAGAFEIPKNAKGGLYKLRAYTQASKAREQFFERDIQVQVPVLPNLRMKLDFDRRAYGPGAEVLAWLDLNTLENKALGDYSFVAKLQLDGKEQESLVGKTDAQGRASIRFELPKDLKTNDGLLNIMLTYKGLNESISRSVPITLGNIDLQFFAEGGQLLAGTKSRIGFKALNEFGKAADIAGEIRNGLGEKIADFSSYHQGMGAFELQARAGESYTAHISAPAGIDKVYSLPKVESKGVALRVDAEGKTWQLSINSSQEQEAFLLVRKEGKLLYSKELPLKRGSNSASIGSRSFPIGIVQVSVLSTAQEPLAERLVFANADKKLNIEISTPKEKYLPREEVKLTVQVRDETGKAVSGFFSLGVTDEKLLSFADDRQGHILSAVLLESELKGQIEEPNFYFDDEQNLSRLKPHISRREALEHLMLTQGWRGFTWEEIAATKEEGNTPAKQEQARFAGVVKAATGEKALKGATIEILGTNFKTTSDAEGKFSLFYPELYDRAMLRVSASGYAAMQAEYIEFNQKLSYLLHTEMRVRLNLSADVGYLSGNVDIYTDKKKISSQNPRNIDIFVPLNTKKLIIKDSKKQFKDGEIALRPNEEQTHSLVLVNKNPPEERRVREMRVHRNSAAKGGRARMVPNAVAAPPPARPQRMPAPAPENHVLNEDNLAAPPAGLMKEEEVLPVVQEPQELLAADEELLDMGDFEQDAFVVNKKDKAPAGNVRRPNPPARRHGAVPPPPPPAPKARYTKVKAFYQPKYEPLKKNTPRTDFRNTIYWNPRVEVKNGKANLSFRTSDALTQFRVSIEGFGNAGQIGRAEQKIFSQKPLELIVKVPAEVLSGDLLSIPLTISNNSAELIEGKLSVQLPENLAWQQEPAKSIAVQAGRSRTITLQCKVQNKTARGTLQIALQDGRTRDQFQSEIGSRSRGFPVHKTYRGDKLSQKYQVQIENPVEGSLQARLQVHPSTLDEVLKDMQSMLRMPSGCFEQTSSSNYPNLLVLDYLRESKQSMPEVEQKAKDMLAVGYQRLTGYESPGGGFDWWGRSPAHEALSAYGILQFTDMQAVHDVDAGYIKRAVTWLMSRRDGKGGWTKNPNCLHTWAKSEITDAYIVWALCEAGYAKKISKEIDKSYKDAVKSEDPYMIALLANAFVATKDSRADALLKDLLKRQDKTGAFKGLNRSVVNSSGNNLDIETTALSSLALMRHKLGNKEVKNALEWLAQQKGYSGYGSTQGTVLALKAFLFHAKSSKQSDAPGKLAIYVDGEKKAVLEYQAGQKEIAYNGLHEFLKAGEQILEIKYEDTKEPMAFDIELSYHTSQPPNSKTAAFGISTKLAKNKGQVGETIRLAIELENKSKESQAMTMAMIGIPAGLSLQPWQLKELQEKQVFDYYELFDGYLVLHYERMEAGERKEIKLDLKADVPGNYEAPASSVFEYYKSQERIWAEPERMQIL